MWTTFCIIEHILAIIGLFYVCVIGGVVLLCIKGDTK